MSNTTIGHKLWWLQNRKWILSSGLGLLLLVFILFYSGISDLLGGYSQAYLDQQVYNDAIEKTQQHYRVKETLGTIKPLNSMTILNGAVHYSAAKDTIYSTIKIHGSKGKAMLDITAYRVENNSWNYKKLTVRIKKPIDKKETIPIIGLIPI